MMERMIIPDEGRNTVAVKAYMHTEEWSCLTKAQSFHGEP